MGPDRMDALSPHALRLRTAMRVEVKRTAKKLGDVAYFHARRSYFWRWVLSVFSRVFSRVRCATRDAGTSRASSQTCSREFTARSSGGPPGRLVRLCVNSASGIVCCPIPRTFDGLFEPAGVDGEREGGVGHRSRRRALFLSSCALFVCFRTGRKRSACRMPVLRS